MIFNKQIESKLNCNFGGGGSPAPPVMPVAAPSATGAAKNITNKIPNQFSAGLASTILTAPTNLMQQEQNSKKTLLGQ